MFAGYFKSGWKIIGYYTDDDTVYFGMTNNVTIVPAEDNALLDLSTWYDLMGYGGDDGLTLSETGTMATIINYVIQGKKWLLEYGLKSSSVKGGDMTKYLKLTSRTIKFLGHFSTGVYLYKTGINFINGDNINGVGNLINAGMSFYMTKGGALGMYSGSVYFIINETVGWPEMGRRQNQIIQNDSYWWRIYSH